MTALMTERRDFYDIARHRFPTTTIELPLEPALGDRVNRKAVVRQHGPRRLRSSLRWKPSERFEQTHSTSISESLSNGNRPLHSMLHRREASRLVQARLAPLKSFLMQIGSPVTNPVHTRNSRLTCQAGTNTG